MIIELPSGGSIYNQETIVPILNNWESIASSSGTNTKFGFSFSGVSSFDTSVAPSIRKFLRKHQVKHLEIKGTDEDAARRILMSICPFVNLEYFSLTNTMSFDIETLLALALCRTAIRLIHIHFCDVIIPLAAFKEWALMLSGLSILLPTQVFSFKSVSLEASNKHFTKIMYRTVAKIVSWMTMLTNFEFKLVNNDSASSGFEFFAKALSPMEGLKILTFSGVDCSNKRILETMFGFRSKMRKTLEQLSLLYCDLDRSIVDKLLAPRPYLRLREINLSGNNELVSSDFIILRKQYLKVVADDFESESDISNDDLLEEIDDDSDGSYWDESQPH